MMEWMLTSSVLILIMMGLRRILKGKISLRLQYALWAVVLIRLLIPWSPVESEISVLNVTKEPEVLAIVDSVREPIRWESQNVATDQESGETHPVSETHFVASTNDLNHFYSPAEVGFALWKWGCGLLLGFMLTSNLVFLRKMKQDREPMKVLGVTVPVYASPVAETPCLVGFLHPAIYLPERNWDKVQLWHVMEHELTHYSHRDHLISVLRCVALALHWYNPLVWWAVKASKEDGELACDEGTLARLGEGERQAYGRTLLELTCVSGRNNVMLTATTMTGSKKSLKERIQRIAKKPQMAAITLIVVIAVMALAVGCTFTGVSNGTDEVIQNQEDRFPPLLNHSEESLEIIQMLTEMVENTRANGEGTIRLQADGEVLVLDLGDAQYDSLLYFFDRYVWEETEVPDNLDGTGVDVMGLALHYTKGERYVVHIGAWDNPSDTVRIIWVHMDDNAREEIRCFTASARDEHAPATLFDALYHVFREQHREIQLEGSYGEEYDFLTSVEQILEENQGAGISYVDGRTPIMRFELDERNLQGLMDLFYQHTWAVEIREFPYSEGDDRFDIWFWDGTVMSFTQYEAGILKSGDTHWLVWEHRPKVTDGEWVFSAIGRFVKELFLDEYDETYNKSITQLLYDEILTMHDQAVLSYRNTVEPEQVQLGELDTRFCAEMIRAYRWIETYPASYQVPTPRQAYTLEGGDCSIHYYRDPEMVEYIRDGRTRYFCPLQTDFTKFTLADRIGQKFSIFYEGGMKYSFEGVTSHEAAQKLVDQIPRILESCYGDLKAEDVKVLSSEWDPYDYWDTSFSYDVRISVPEEKFRSMELEYQEVEQDGDRIILDLEFCVEGANETFWACDYMKLERENLIPS